MRVVFLRKVLGIGSLIVLTMFTTAKAQLLDGLLPLELPLQFFTTIRWNASPDSNVAGYAAYYSVGDLPLVNRVDAGNSLTATLPLIVGSVNSIYVVAYNASGVESAPSNVVDYTPPAMSRLKLARQAGNSLQLQFRTSPLALCRVDYTPQLNPPQWQTLGATLADAFGDVVVNDPLAGSPPARYYRAVKQ